MSFSLSYLARIVLFFVFSYAVVYLYIDNAGDWVPYGKGLLTFNPIIYFIEIPFFILIASVVYFPSVKNIILRNCLPLIPGLVLYGLFDTFYGYFGRVATPSDFSNLFDVFSFSIELALGVIFLYLLIPISIFLSVYFNRIYSFSELKKALIIRVLIFLAAIVLLASPVTTWFQNNNFNYTVWAQEDTIRENGRFFSSVFYAKQEYANAQMLAKYSEQQSRINVKHTLFPGNLITKKNIHIVVLESFIDPRLIDEISLKSPIIADELLKYLGKDNDFSRIVTPIYGGGTAESEFELLTGIQGLGKVNQIEFNVMQGNRTDSFVNILRSQNYYAQATIAPSSEYFNSKRAYQSLGFDKVLYLQDDNLLKRDSDDETIFDGDLLDYNLKFIINHMATNRQPLFNYVLGMYGHLPFERNIKKRPDVVSNVHSDERLSRITNQFYYRTKALAMYLDQLTRIDPNAIIFITSDHLPSILGSQIHYKLNNKMNIALMLNGGKNSEINNKGLYQIPWLIWDKLSFQSLDRAMDESKMDELYFTLLSQSLLREP